MSTITQENTIKASYKNVVVLEEQSQLPTNTEQAVSNIVEFDSLEQIKDMFPTLTNASNNLQSISKRTLPSPLRYMLTDMITMFAELTSEVVNTYDIKGIANDLKVCDILDCFEDCLHVSCHTDIDAEGGHTSDEDTIIDMK
jgi:hypothetical protein